MKMGSHSRLSSEAATVNLPTTRFPSSTISQALAARSLTGRRFAVLGLGDSSYEDFCGFAKKCQAELERAGALPILPPELCDINHEERLSARADALAAELAGETAASA